MYNGIPKIKRIKLRDVLYTPNSFFLEANKQIQKQLIMVFTIDCFLRKLKEYGHNSIKEKMANEHSPILPETFSINPLSIMSLKVRCQEYYGKIPRVPICFVKSS